MVNIFDKNRNLPFNCGWVCLSLVGGSLMLAFIFFIFYMGYISASVAIWAAMIVFILLAGYESFLFYLLTRFWSKEAKS